MHRSHLRRPLVILAAFTCLLGAQQQRCRALAGEPTGQLAAFAKSRTWSDATGKFKIEGQLKFASADEVQLTQASGRTLKIAVEKLSTTDQQFVRLFLETEQMLGSAAGGAEDPFQVVEDAASSAPTASFGSKPAMDAVDSRGLPADTPADTQAAVEGDVEADAEVDANTDQALNFALRQPIVKGAKQIYAKLDKPFWSATPPRGFPAVKFDDMVIKTDLSKPFFAKMRVLSAGLAGVSVLGAYQQGRSGDGNYSRFVLARAQDGFTSDVLELPAPWKLMAISADGTRVAVVRVEGFDKGNDVGIFRVTKTGLVPEFQFTAGGGSWDELHYVGFAAGNRLITISQKHTLVVWDLAHEKGPKAIFQGNSGGSLHAVLSPAGELMALPAGTSIAVIDTLSAKVVGLIARQTKASQISFSQDGSLLAAFEPFEVALYNLSDGTLARKLAVTEHRDDTPLNWVGKHLLVGPVVYDVERGLPLWTYEGNPTSRSTVGSYLVCGFGGEKSSSLTINQVPHEAVLAEAASIDPKTIYALRPGDAVMVDYRFNTTPAETQAAVRSVVEAKINKLGWKLSNDAPHKILIELEQGPSDTADYYTQTGGGPFLPHPMFGRAPSGPKETVTFTPWTHKITIMGSAGQIYQATHVRGAPDGLQTKEGESTQAAVTKYSQPSAGYFEHLPIPPHLLKPEFQGGLGKSKLNANGLQ